MFQTDVNGWPSAGLSRLENWGELLDLLESGDRTADRGVTAVRFGGVAPPSIREAPGLGRELQNRAPIEIETATVAQHVYESARATYDRIELLGCALRRIGGGLQLVPALPARESVLLQVTAA